MKYIPLIIMMVGCASNQPQNGQAHRGCYSPTAHSWCRNAFTTIATEKVAEK